jgi:cholesterol oxidase
LQLKTKAVLLALLAWPALASARDGVHAPHYDVIIIGSGYGGAVSALRLGEAQASTLVLERGRAWKVDDTTQDATFATLESVIASGDPRSTWLNDVCIGNLYTSAFGPPIPCQPSTGILDSISDQPNLYDAAPKMRVKGVTALVAAGVGGGSLVNNAITYQPTKQGWDAAFPPAELPGMQRVWYELSRKYFAMARAGLSPSLPPADVLASPSYAGTVLLDQLFAAAGYPEEDPARPETLTFGRSYIPLITDWNAVREELAGRRVPATSIGEAWYGTNSGAKKSLDQPGGYLDRALKTGHVELRALHTVSDIAYDERRKLYTVTAVHTDESYQEIDTVQFTTRNLVLAAGSIGSTKLLVRARDSGRLPRLSPHVGTRFSTNGNQAHLRFISNDFVQQGGPAGLKVTDFAEADNPVVIENLPQRVPSWFAQVPDLMPFYGAVMTIAIGVPRSLGTFSYDRASDTVTLDWPEDGAQNVYDRAVSVLTNPALPGTPLIFEANQAMSLTLHPLGGVPLGVATDARCELRGYDRLWAVDGSLVPGASAVANPSLIITALAERCMSYVVEKVRHDCGG